MGADRLWGREFEGGGGRDPFPSDISSKFRGAFFVEKNHRKNDQKTEPSKNYFFSRFLRFLGFSTSNLMKLGSPNGSPEGLFWVFFEYAISIDFWHRFCYVFRCFFGMFFKRFFYVEALRFKVRTFTKQCILRYFSYVDDFCRFAKMLQKCIKIWMKKQCENQWKIL